MTPFSMVTLSGIIGCGLTEFRFLGLQVRQRPTSSGRTTTVRHGKSWPWLLPLLALLQGFRFYPCWTFNSITLWPMFGLMLITSWKPWNPILHSAVEPIPSSSARMNLQYSMASSVTSMESIAKAVLWAILTRKELSSCSKPAENDLHPTLINLIVHI